MVAVNQAVVGLSAACHVVEMEAAYLVVGASCWMEVVQTLAECCAVGVRPYSPAIAEYSSVSYYVQECLMDRQASSVAVLAGLVEETGTVDSMEASDPAANRVVSSWVFRVWWHQMEEVGAAAVSVVLVKFAAGLVVVQPETVAVQVALVLVETAEEICPVEHGGVEVEDGAVVESTGDAARWVICFEMGMLAEAEVAGHGATILTVHGAGAAVLETYSFENRQPWEEDWSEVFPLVHLHEVAMVQVEEVAAAVLNPVAEYLPLLF